MNNDFITNILIAVVSKAFAPNHLQVTFKLSEYYSCIQDLVWAIFRFREFIFFNLPAVVSYN